MPDLRSVLEKRAGRGRSVDPTEALRRVRERLDAPWAESLGSRRRSWGATIALVGVTCLVVVVVGTGLVIARHHDRLSTGSSPAPRSKPGPPSGWHRHQDGPAGFRIDYPGSWHRAATSLTPNLGDPTQLAAVGSYPLPVGGPNCAQEPVAALNRLGLGDGFVWVSEWVPFPRIPVPAYPPRPRRFELLPTAPEKDPEVGDCLGRVPRFAFQHLTFTDGGRSFSVLLAVGSKATGQTRSDLLAVLNSFTVTPMTGPAPPTPAQQDALRAWAEFPAQASPRPLVLTQGTVVGPAGGFPSNATKDAFSAGFFTDPPELPSGPPDAQGFPIVSAAQALTALRDGGDKVGTAAPLTITDVRLGSARFQTDRGRVPLPAWLFSFQETIDPAAVLAVVPSAQYTSPDWNPRIPFAGGGAQVSADGRTLNLTVIGAAEGTGPCTADYAATATESSNAVAVEVHETLHMTSAPVACEQVGYPRQITVRLVAPLGPRVLVDTKARAPIVAQP